MHGKVFRFVHSLHNSILVVHFDHVTDCSIHLLFVFHHFFGKINPEELSDALVCLLLDIILKWLNNLLLRRLFFLTLRIVFWIWRLALFINIDHSSHTWEPIYNFKVLVALLQVFVNQLLIQSIFFLPGQNAADFKVIVLIKRLLRIPDCGACPISKVTTP